MTPLKPAQAAQRIVNIRIITDYLVNIKIEGASEPLGG